MTLIERLRPCTMRCQVPVNNRLDQCGLFHKDAHAWVIRLRWLRG